MPTLKPPNWFTLLFNGKRGQSSDNCRWRLSVNLLTTSWWQRIWKGLVISIHSTFLIYSRRSHEQKQIRCRHHPSASIVGRLSNWIKLLSSNLHISAVISNDITHLLASGLSLISINLELYSKCPTLCRMNCGARMSRYVVVIDDFSRFNYFLI